VTTLFNDIKYAFRQLRKSPGFTIAVVLTLALGLGTTTAVFSVVDAVLLRALPYDDPDQLVQVSMVRDNGRIGSVSYPFFEDWRDQSHCFSHLAAYKGKTMDFVSADGPVRLEGVRVSQEFFETLGIKAALGRTFVRGDDEPDAGSVAVISHDLWRRSLGEDPDVLGRTIVLDEAHYTIIGVMPRDFHFELMEETQCWTPLTDRLPRTKHTYQIIGRLQADVTLAQCHAEMKALSQRIAQAYPDQSNRGAHVEPLFDFMTRRSRLFVFSLMGAITLVLLIACVNVAHLILARSTTRAKEIAIRQALGAGLLRITRQTLTENLVLTCMGGAAGILIAHGLSQLMRAYFVNLYLPRIERIGIDGRVLVFALLLSVVTGLALGLVPVLRGGRYRLQALLMVRSSRGPRPNRMSDVLVVFEIGAALILLIGTVLMIRTCGNLMKEDPGFQTAGLLTFKCDLPASRYGQDSQRATFCQQALQRLTAIPGVDQAGMDAFMPFGRRSYNTTLTACGKYESEGRGVQTVLHKVTASTFSTLGLPALQGRHFTRQDERLGTQVAVVNQRLAQQVWPGQNALGQHLMLGYHPQDDLTEAYEVIGVVPDAHQGILSEEIGPCAYFPYGAQASERTLGFMVRSESDPMRLIPAVRKALAELDPYLPLYELSTMNQRIAQTFGLQRFLLTFLGTAGSMAVILVIMGIYGVVSLVVAQRSHELGIRMAIGARSNHILAMILSKGLLLAALGGGLGIVGALGLTRFLSAGLYGVSSTDPMTFIIALLLLTGVTLLACWIPARRAAKIDPMEALRYE